MISNNIAFPSFPTMKSASERRNSDMKRKESLTYCSSNGEDTDASLDVSQSYDGIMKLPESLSARIPKVYDTKLTPLDLSFGTVRKCNYEMTVRDAALKPIHMDKDKATVCFLVKRPGCVLCREQGQALSEIAAEYKLDVSFFAVIKETGADKKGILSLYQDYYKFPFYLDKKWELYSAMGKRLVGVVPNPVSLYKQYQGVRRRLKEKKIEGNIIGKGEGLILGGVLIFDAKGEIRYAHEELFLRELPAQEIRQALNIIIREKRSSSRRGGL